MLERNVQLTDGLILLRQPRPADIPAITVAVRESLAELQPWMDWATAAYDEAAARRWLEFTTLAWEHTSSFPFAITEALTGQYLGVCGLDGLDPKARCCNLGYWVRTSRARQGLASRAARLAGRFAFEEIGLVRAEIVIAVENLASQRVAEKVGAKREGIFPNRMVVREEVYDAVIYALTPADLGLEPK
jgi:ribosomal-protein-serine acetyltransferase